MKTTTHSLFSSYFFSQPHQPFFLMGIFWAIVSITLFASGYTGKLEMAVDVAFFHFYTLVYIVFTHLFFGFLFTTFARFCATAPIEKKRYITIWTLFETGTILFLLASHSFLILASMIVLLSAHILGFLELLSIFLKAKNPYKEDPKWMLWALGLGLFSHLLAIIWLQSAAPMLLELAKMIGFYLYLIFLTFAVAQRMVPFFSHSQAPRNPYLLGIIFSLFLLRALAALLELAPFVIAFDMTLGTFCLYEFRRWELRTLSSPPILWILHVGLYWFVAAFFIDALAWFVQMQYAITTLYAGVHAFALGFLTTILIGFGSRVTLGHSGQRPHADTLTQMLFYFTFFVLFSRLALSLSHALSLYIEPFLWLSALSWIILFALWAARYAKVLLFGSE